MPVQGRRTLTCEDGTKIRFLLIDCPEMKQGEWGARSKEALAALTPVGSTVRLEVDVQPRDRYVRLLAYVFLADGRMTNEELARQGFAVALTYPPNVKHVERIRAAVEDAMAAKRGLWATSEFECSPGTIARRDAGEAGGDGVGSERVELTRKSEWRPVIRCR